MTQKLRSTRLTLLDMSEVIEAFRMELASGYLLDPSFREDWPALLVAQQQLRDAAAALAACENRARLNKYLEMLSDDHHIRNVGVA